MKTPRWLIPALGLALLALGTSSRAWAGNIETITLNEPGTTLSSYTGPFGTVTIDLTSSTTATVTFDSDTNGGYIYTMGGVWAADLNVNASTFTISTPVETSSLSGFTPTFLDQSTGVVTGFGNFNLVINNSSGFADSATQISFTLTDTSGTWSAVSQVLTANANGYGAADHAFACATSATNACTGSSSPSANGYAAADFDVVPEPAAAALLGTALLCACWFLRRFVPAEVFPGSGSDR